MGADCLEKMLHRGFLAGKELAVEMAGIPVDQHAAEVRTPQCHDPRSPSAPLIPDILRQDNKRIFALAIAHDEAKGHGEIPGSFGISPIGWSKRTCRKRARIRPLETRLKAAGAGFEASELSNKFQRFGGAASDPRGGTKLITELGAGKASRSCHG
jgi:hypothetical protein